MNKIYGYARVSSKDQNLERQIESLIAYGVDDRDIITDKQSGKDFNRPGYIALCQSMLRPGDTLVIKELDRLGRDYEQIKNEWRNLQQKGVDIVVIDTPIINTANKSDLEKNLISNIVFEIMAYTAEKERNKIHQRQKEGIENALLKGRPFGRPSMVMPDNWDAVYQSWMRKEITGTKAIELLGMTRTTFYKKVNENSKNYNNKKP